jgi:hypothetical protein
MTWTGSTPMDVFICFLIAAAIYGIASYVGQPAIGLAIALVFLLVSLYAVLVKRPDNR